MTNQAANAEEEVRIYLSIKQHAKNATKMDLLTCIQEIFKSSAKPATFGGSAFSDIMFLAGCLLASRYILVKGFAHPITTVQSVHRRGSRLTSP